MHKWAFALLAIVVSCQRSNREDSLGTTERQRWQIDAPARVGPIITAMAFEAGSDALMVCADQYSVWRVERDVQEWRHLVTSYECAPLLAHDSVVYRRVDGCVVRKSVTCGQEHCTSRALPPITRIWHTNAPCTLVIASRDNELLIWRHDMPLTTAKFEHTINAADVSPDGKSVAVGCLFQGGLHLVDVERGTAERLAVKTFSVTDVAWSPSGTQFAAAMFPVPGDAPDLFLVNPKTSQVTELSKGKGTMRVAFIPGADTIISGAIDGSVWRYSGQAFERANSTSVFAEGLITALAIDAQGECAAVAGKGGRIQSVRLRN